MKALDQRNGTAPKNDMDTMFGQAFTQFQNVDPFTFATKEQAWTVEFVGEGAVDVGGPYRESLSQFCSELQSTSLSLFQQSPNGTHNIGIDREMWVPNPSAISSDQLTMYQFLGELLGLSLHSQITLNLDFPSIVYKQLIGSSQDTLDIQDLQAVDTMVVQSLDALRKIDQQGVTSENFSEVILEVFAIQSSDGHEIELKPNGKSIPVTFENRFEWCDLVEQARLHEFDRQVANIRRGLSHVVPRPVLFLFSWSELKLIIEGKAVMDIELLKKHTVYRGGYREDHPVIQNLWKLIESFTPRQQSMFLRFTWGRSRLPLFGAQFTQEFKVSRKDTPAPDKSLPESHTCFFELELPEYSSFEVLKQKLFYAITECEAIDTDFNPQNMEIWDQA